MANLLPEDLISSEIFVRLPLKSLARFTSICKRWRSLITSIDFHIATTSHNPPHNSPSLLINWISNGHHGGISIVNKDHNNVLIKRIDNSILDSCKQIYSHYKSYFEAAGIYYSDLEQTAYVIGSVHGLLCLCQTVPYPFLFIWNPLTKMFKTIRDPTRDSSEVIIYKRSGFYYDEVDRDFRIIEITRCKKRSETEEVLIRVKVYSCNVGTWKEIRDHSLSNAEFCIAGIFNDIVYVCFYSNPSVLVGFDVHDEVFKRLPCPERVVERDTKRCPYINWHESLGIVAYKEPIDGEAAYDEKDVYIYDEASSSWIEKYKKAVYIYDEASCSWIEKYIAPDALGSYRLLHGSQNDGVVVEENKIVVNRDMSWHPLILALAIEMGSLKFKRKNSGILKLFEAESSQFKNLIDVSALAINARSYTSVSALVIDVRSYTESLVWINGMHQH